MTAEPEVLKGLVGAEAVDEFLRDYWPGRLFVARGDLERLPQALLHEELNHFEALSRRYKGVVSFFGDAKSGHMVPVEGIEAAAPYRCGLSVYLTDVSPYFPEVDRMVRDLERELGKRGMCPGRRVRFADQRRHKLPLRFGRRDFYSIARHKEVRRGARCRIEQSMGIPVYPRKSADR